MKTRKIWIEWSKNQNKRYIRKVHFVEPKVAYVGSFSYRRKGKLHIAPIFEEQITEGKISYHLPK